MMPGALDATMLPLALDLINEYGKTVTISRNPTSVAQPGQGTVSAGAVITRDYIVSPPESVSKELVGKNGVLETDSMVMLPAKDLGWEPTPASILNVLIGNVTWQCVAAPPQYSGEEVCLYVLVLRA